MSIGRASNTLHGSCTPVGAFAGPADADLVREYFSHPEHFHHQAFRAAHYSIEFMKACKASTTRVIDVIARPGMIEHKDLNA